MDLCYAAQKYKLPNLVAKCIEYIMSILHPHYTCKVLEYANLFEDENLKVYELYIIAIFYIVNVYNPIIIHAGQVLFSATR